MSSSPAPAAPRPMRDRTFLGHPLGLFVLFFTEMWERFSYYGMRALLILYMVNYFKWTDGSAPTIYKIYTTLVYVTPILGGFLADRYLGNRLAVIIGALLMAIGHFLMAFEERAIFYSALGFLIIGNGFFKPNMSTQVGFLYPPNDPRRDGAYTIFYMGINIGAFLAPIACGWLAQNTVGEYHSGFTLAGIGMVVGLLIYLAGQKLIYEVPPVSATPTPAVTDVPAAPEVVPAEPRRPRALSEAEAAAVPSVLGDFGPLLSKVLQGVGVFLVVAAVALVGLQKSTVFDGAILALAGVSLAFVTGLAARFEGGVRDRILAILGMGLFVVFFWAAFEQAGNVLNIWADKHTNRYVTLEDVPPVARLGVPPDPVDPVRFTLVERFQKMFTLKPKPAPEGGAEDAAGTVVDPIPPAWFQSINALWVFTLAPVMAWLWVWLSRKGWEPPIPLKMAVGLALMSSSTAVMISAANLENGTTTRELAGPLERGELKVQGGVLGRLPTAKKDKPAPAFTPLNAGRIAVSGQTLTLTGVLSDTARDSVVGASSPQAFRDALDALKEESKKVNGTTVTEARVPLPELPPGFDLGYAGLPPKTATYDPATRELVAGILLTPKELVALKVAAGDPYVRDVMNGLMAESIRFRVSPMWLVLVYLLATLGELCLSPIGLSMVNKLAPRSYSTMLMGIWMLTTAFGNFAAGSFGEVWDVTHPVTFFTLVSAMTATAAVLLFAAHRLMGRLMHGVN